MDDPESCTSVDTVTVPVVCASLGINKESSFLEDLQRIDPAVLNNGHIYEIHCHIKSCRVPWKKVLVALGNAYQQDWSAMQPDALLIAFNKVRTGRRRLIKTGRDRLRLIDYLQQPFVPPLPSPKRPRKSTSKATSPFGYDSPAPTKKSKFDAFQDEVVTRATQGILFDLSQKEGIIREQQQDITRLQKENSKLKRQNEYLKQQLMLHNTSRCTQTIKRKQSSSNLWRQKYKNLNWNNSVKTVKDRKQGKSAVMVKSQSVKRQMTEKCLHMNALKDQQHELMTKKQQVEYLENEVEKLVESQSSGPDIPTQMDGKTYTRQIREASYILQNAGVSQKRTSDTIRKVAKAITGQTVVGPLPCYKLQNSFNKEMKSVSIQQAVDMLASQGAELNRPSKDGMTPLSIAAFWGYADIAKMLLKHGADVNARNMGTLWTPMHCAAFQGHGPVILKLMDAKPDLSSRDMRGRTAVDFGSAMDSIWSFFAAAGCKRTPKSELLKMDIVYKVNPDDPGLADEQYGQSGYQIRGISMSDYSKDPNMEVAAITGDVLADASDEYLTGQRDSPSLNIYDN